MSDNETSTAGLTLESLQQKISALESRVAELEAEVEHEHEDIEALKTVTEEDHRRLDSLKVGTSPTPPPPSVTPVGL